jgi:AhpD family alkylhydroperoxidase
VLAAIGRICGTVPDASRVMLHRPDDFGRPYAALLHRVMRGPSDWTPPERELLAAYFSSVDGSRYCAVSHGELACLAGLAREVDRVRQGNAGAAADPRLRAAYDFLAAFAIGGSALGARPIGRLQSAGVSVEATRDLIYLGFVSCIGDRIADALGFTVPTQEDVRRAWPLVRLRGYRP